MEESAEQEALRLKTLAEHKYNSSNLKSALKYANRAHRLSPKLDGIAEMVTAFKILQVAATTAADGGTTGPATPDWYKVLQIEHFSHINTIKKQYKKLALSLHPDKNPFLASEEAFKLVGEAFRVLSDKIRRKEYDMKLRIAIQSAATDGCGVATAETFWTACSTCRLLHQFDKRYLGHNLMCPSCKKSFKAMEVSGDVSHDEEGRVGTRTSVRIRSSERTRTVATKRKMSSVGEVLERSKPNKVESVRNVGVNRDSNSDDDTLIMGLRSMKEKMVGKKDEESKSKRVKNGEETMTLAEMQIQAKKKVQEKMKLKEMEKEKEKEKRERSGDSIREYMEMGKRRASKSAILEVERRRASKTGDLEFDRRRASKSGDLELDRQRASRSGDLEFDKSRASKSANLELDRHRVSKSGVLEIMSVEDSDFYDFDRDRVEKNFKKGQVWAIYDDDDGMPRHYGLIDEVVSAHRFEVKMSWLDLQNNGDEGLICWEKMGFHISCGRFKVSKKTSIYSVNVFSHIADSERAAREVYRIYPKKGSTWALYNENVLDTEGRTNMVAKDKRCYDIVVFLTSYSEIHGLSMAYLEKVDGFRTVFKRREIGCHAIRWLEKDDFRLFSHQIPARKLSGEEAPSLPKDCWELDPASLPPELLGIGWER